MSHHHTRLRDEALFRILKTKGHDIPQICEKLEFNIRNICILSEDELCELWYHIKLILLNAQKLCIIESKNDVTHSKEYSLMIKLMHTITAMAVETITKRTFIPNVLLEIVMILHTVILPKINNKKVKDEISFFLENWWKLNLVWKEKVIVNALKYLIHGASSSLQNVKRLNNMKSALYLLKDTEDVQELLMLARKKKVLSRQEGKALLSYLFTLGEAWIMGIHCHIKVMMEHADTNCIINYADLYATAWLNGTAKIKRVITENCLQEYIFHCLRANRDSKGRDKIGVNLLAFLKALQSNENNTVKKMVFEQYNTLLWKHLKAPGSYVRCNAADLLFLAYPMRVSLWNKVNLCVQKQHSAMTELLQDSSHEVCLIAIHGVTEILRKHWDTIPKNIVQEWLNILMVHTQKSSYWEVRIRVFDGIKNVSSNEDSLPVLRKFLPNCSNSIYDTNTNVVEALIKLILHTQDNARPFLDIIPTPYILERLEVTNENTSLCQKLVKLLWRHIIVPKKEPLSIIRDLLNMGTTNINATRKLFHYSECVIKWNKSIELMDILLKAIEKEMINLTKDNELRKSCNKRLKLSDNKSDQVCNGTPTCNLEIESSDKFEDISILLDVIIILLGASNTDFVPEDVREDVQRIILKVANILPQLFECLKESSAKDSVIFLFSLVPLSSISNEAIICDTFLKELHNPNISDNTIITIIHLLITWQKVNIVFTLLSDLLKDARQYDGHKHQETNDKLNECRKNTQVLQLSWRVLKYLLHTEFRSVLKSKYHQDLFTFWNTFHTVQYFIEITLDEKGKRNDEIFTEIIFGLFHEYVTILSMLHGTDLFNAADHFCEILVWVRKKILPHVPDLKNIENNQFSIDIIKSVFETFNVLAKQSQITSKLCCDTILLYSECMFLPSGITFVNEALNTTIALLDLTKIICKSDECDLLYIILPRHFSAVMISLTKYPRKVISAHTKDLRLLPTVFHKYFSTVESVFKNREKHLSYVTIVFNTAVTSISKELKHSLQRNSNKTENILHRKFPYLAEKILKVVFHLKKYQQMCLQVLSKAVPKYSKIDLLSALLIIHRLLQSSIKVPLTDCQDIAQTAKFQNEQESDRCVDDLISIVIAAILQ